MTMEGIGGGSLEIGFGRTRLHGMSTAAKAASRGGIRLKLALASALEIPERVPYTDNATIVCFFE